MFLRKDELLEEFKLTADQFFVAYAASNCSDLVPLDEHAKFSTNADYVIKNPYVIRTFDFQQKGVSAERHQQFRAQMEALWNSRHQRTTIIYPTAEAADRPTKPLWLRFCEEVKSDGSLCRPQLLERMKEHFGLAQPKSSTLITIKFALIIN